MPQVLCLSAIGLQRLDWWIVIVYLIGMIAIGVALSKRGRKSSEDYFKSGGGMPWWLLGTSMVATTFAADTPLALSGWVVTSGISQNWFWWCGVPVVLGGVFFFARLWKRANPLTDMEFVYVRYSGGAADFLRGFKAVYLAVPYGCIVMGWVNMAMAKIINLTIPNFPRLPGVDAMILALVLHTPLSQAVNPEVRAACQRGDLRPLQIAAEYQLLKYENASFFSDVENNAYEGRAAEALATLGAVADHLRPDSLEGMKGVPERLYIRSGAEDGDGSEAGASVAPPAASASAASMTRAVTLANGHMLEYAKLRRFEGEALAAGQAERARALRGAAPRQAPLAGMAPVDFLHQIYKIAANVNQLKILFLLFLITIAYTLISGLWGVLVTDFLQFWIAMFGCVAMAWFAVRQCGGMEAMMLRMSGIYSLEKARAMISLVPTGHASGLGLMSRGEFWIYVLLVWWTVGFTDGGSYFAQRMLSAKDERHAALGYLWFGIAHFALRMWPWIIVGFAAAVLFPFVPYANGKMPGASVAEDGFIRVLLEVLPPGLVGLMIAALFAAYMSTISTQVNLGASYLMNDFYRPFIAPRIERRTGRRFEDRHYLRIGMAMTLVMAALGIILSVFISSVAQAWFILASFNSGIGVIYLLRWYWSRINAWTEVVCIGCLLYFAACVMWFKGAIPGLKMDFPFSLLIALPFSVSMALLATLLTPPTDRAKLIHFCKTVQPGGPGWRGIEEEIRREEPGWRANSPLTAENFRLFLLACVCVFCFLFGIGKVVIGDTLYPTITGENAALGMSAIALLAAMGLNRLLPRRMNWAVFTGAFLLIFLAQMGLRALFGHEPEEFFFNFLFRNRSIGVVMLLLGTVLGWIVALSFAPRKWASAAPQASAR